MRPHLDNPVVLARRVANQLAFVDGLRKRLFDVNVFPRLAGQEGDVGVPMIGGGDNDALDILVVQQVPELLGCAGRLALRFFQVRIDLVEDRLVEIAEGLDLGAALDGSQGITAALIAASNQSQYHSLIGPNSARVPVKESAGGKCGSHPYFLHKRPACFAVHECLLLRRSNPFTTSCFQPKAAQGAILPGRKTRAASDLASRKRPQ